MSTRSSHFVRIVAAMSAAAIAIGCERPSESTAAVTLGAATAASLPTGVGAAPVIALAPAGDRAVGWVSAPDSGSDGRLYVSVNGAAPTELRDSLGAIEAHGEAPPKIVYDSRGVLHALYVVGKEVPGRRFPLSALRYVRSEDGGKSWSAPHSVTDAAVFGSYNFHALHVAADGSLYAAWLDGREGKSATYLTRSTDGGVTWEANRRVAPGESCPCCRTAIATAPGNVVYIAWRAVLPGNVRDVVVARSVDGGTTFGAPVRVHADDWVFDACPHAGPSMSTDAQGRLHVAWWTGKDGAAGVYYAVSSDRASTFSPPIAMGVAEFSRPSHVQLALSDSGHVAVSWDDGTLEIPVITLRVSTDNGATFSAPERPSDVQQSATYPMMRWGGRDVTVVWSQQSAEAAAHAEHMKPAPGDKQAVHGLPRVGASQVLMRTATVQ